MYDTWEVIVAKAIAQGGIVISPNGLPVRCIRGNLLLEDEHADHPDYKFPVDVAPTQNLDVNPMGEETHALIYTDGYIAATIYECCYAVWDNRGRLLYGCLGHWKEGAYRLSDASLTKILELSRPKSKDRIEGWEFT